MNIKWKFVKNRDLKEEVYSIASIKDEHWTFGINSQLMWMEKNVTAEDIHLMGIDEESSDLVAYLALIHVKVDINDVANQCLGLSNVCVDKKYEGKGIGSELVLQASRFIIERKKKGILLCKDALIHFYNKNGWELLKYREAYINEVPYSKSIMIYNSMIMPAGCSIVISKNF